jgi:uncharacterized membrane protein
MGNKNVNFLVKAGIIAAIYAVLTIIPHDLSYGPFQFRIAEAMTILPMFETAAIPGLAVGCFFANFFGGYGFVDIFFGSLITLLAAYLTSKIKNKYYAILPPILLNAFIVSIWVSKISNIQYKYAVGTIGFGEFITAGILGIILSTIFERVTK